MDKRLPDSILPELRGKWVKYMGAREVVQAAAVAMQRLEKEYQDLLNMALRLQGFDVATNWKIDLESGAIAEVTAADVVRQPEGAVPWVAPTNDSPN